MKITKRQLIKLIKEAINESRIYVDPKGVAIRSQDVPASVAKKDAMIAKSDPRLEDLMGGSRSQRNMGRELGRSIPNIDPGYHGAEDIYISDPEGFVEQNRAVSGDEYHVILFEMMCNYEDNHDGIDHDLLSQTFTDNGLVHGEVLLANDQRRYKYPYKYIFGSTSAFDGDPDNYLESIINHLDDEYSSYGFNRPCYHEINMKDVHNLGRPTDPHPVNKSILKSLALQNSKKLDFKELTVVREALTSQDEEIIRQLGHANPDYAIHDIRLDFMSHVAEAVIGIGKGAGGGSIIDDTRSGHLTYTIESGGVF